jgi:hypothetical protein
LAQYEDAIDLVVFDCGAAAPLVRVDRDAETSLALKLFSDRCHNLVGAGNANRKIIGYWITG